MPCGRKFFETIIMKRAAKTSASNGEASISRSYNTRKDFDGQQYTGMQVGRSHKWNYDKGVWRETKVTPDRWEISYHVTKRRAGHAPEGTGAAVGTGYHWFILSHQYVEKLNANDYTTGMTGIKFKLAHKRAGNDKWSLSENAQRKQLIKLLKDFIGELEREPEKTVPVPLNFEYRKKKYKGVGIPVISSCENGVCQQVDITLNKKHVGVLKHTKSGWRITDTPQGLTTAIQKEVAKNYEYI
jgi:hypothetical protein